MANKLEEVPSDPEAKDQAENPSDEPLSAQPEEEQIQESEQSKQETQQMEVHHHGHIHSEKKWKEYFFQFFMLFLAVFCGFLAEWKLEKTIEHHREEEYMRSMVEDLQSDITEIDTRINEIDTMRLPIFEAALNQLYGNDFSDSAVTSMYKTVPRASRFLSVYFEARTIDQLRNGGNLRLIKCKEVTDSLAEYWKECDIISDVILPGYAEIRSKTKELGFNLFNMSYFENYHPFSPLKAGIQPKLLTEDKTQLIKMGNYIANMQSQSGGPLRVALTNAKSKANNLIVLINKEYHLE